MAIKIPFEKANSRIRAACLMLKTLHFDAKVEATPHSSIELIINKGPFGDDHYYVPVDPNNFVDLADVEQIWKIAHELRAKVIAKEGEVLKFTPRDDH